MMPDAPDQGETSDEHPDRGVADDGMAPLINNTGEDVDSTGSDDAAGPTG